MYNVNLIELKDEILKLAEESPDFNYLEQGVPTMGCSYVGASIGALVGKPCIIGQALQRLGVPEQALREWENRRHKQEVDTAAYTLLQDTSIITLTGEDFDIMDAIAETQSAQDTHCTWGQAVIPLKSFAKLPSSV